MRFQRMKTAFGKSRLVITHDYFRSFNKEIIIYCKRSAPALKKHDELNNFQIKAKARVVRKII